MDEIDFEAQYADELELLEELENKENTSSVNQKAEAQKEPTKKISFDNKKYCVPGFESVEIDDHGEIECDSKKPRYDPYNCEVLRENLEPTTKQNQSSIVIEKIPKEKKTISSSSKIEIIQNEYINLQLLNITYLSGTKSKIKMFEAKDSASLRIKGTNINGLLEKPLDVLKMEINNDMIEKFNKKNESDIMDVKEISNQNEQSHTLWVEKYSPKSFIDLLSDDGINRLMLTWIKSWDHVVFGKEVKAKEKNADPSTNKKRKRIFNQNEIELEEKLSELDEYKRPKIKVALLSGSPGVGKTTLAHMIAKIAGYNVIEMNASDDRSVDAFKTNIEAVTQNRGNVADKEFKPNCLIIDEIDGAPLSSIQILVNQINDNANKGKGKGKEGPTLMRPIICICNDLYASSLKQLRQVSIVFQTPPLMSYRLAERLTAICEENKIKTDVDALMALCEKSGNDIRLCLNTLQFLSKAKNKLTTQMISQINVGQKDQEKGLFNILEELFYSTGFKKIIKANQGQANRITHVLNLCHNFEIDRLILGLHENLFVTNLRDSKFETTSLGYDWFMFCDTIDRQIKEKQDYSLFSYQRYLPVLINSVFSSVNQRGKKFQYPSSHFEAVSKLRKVENTISHFLLDMQASVRVSNNSPRQITLDLLPYLTEIIKPNLRAVSTQLFSKAEKERLEGLITVMISYNLNYRQERCADGQYAYILEPLLEPIVKLSGLKQRKQLCYTVKQQIAREITIERLKIIDKNKLSQGQSEGSQEKGSKKQVPNMFKSKDAKTPGKQTNNDKKMSLQEQISSSESLKKINDADKKAKLQNEDMFARYFKKIPKEPTIFNETTNQVAISSVSKKTISRTDKNTIWLKYKEGFINAVRYNIKINKLL